MVPFDSGSIIAQVNLDAMCKRAEETPPGCFAEIGVYRGGSAQRLMAIAKQQNRALHLFDTFRGIPFCCEYDQHNIGDFADTNEAEVRRVLPDAVFHVGVFPETMPEDMEKVAFLHIDGDQYQTYLDAIRLFSPLMVKGGVMWFDDYNCLASAKKAVDELLGDIVYIDQCGKAYAIF